MDPNGTIHIETTYPIQPVFLEIIAEVGNQTIVASQFTIEVFDCISSGYGFPGMLPSYRSQVDGSIPTIDV